MLVIAERGFRTLLFTDNGIAPNLKPDSVPLLQSFSASRMAAAELQPVRVFETNAKVDPLPVRPINENAKPPK